MLSSYFFLLALTFENTQLKEENKADNRKFDHVVACVTNLQCSIFRSMFFREYCISDYQLISTFNAITL